MISINLIHIVVKNIFPPKLNMGEFLMKNKRDFIFGFNYSSVG